MKQEIQIPACRHWEVIIWFNHSAIQPTNEAATFVEELLYVDTELGAENAKANMLSLKGKHIYEKYNPSMLPWPWECNGHFILDNLGTDIKDGLKAQNLDFGRSVDCDEQEQSQQISVAQHVE